MSGPLQKLNEVLSAVASEENIEISIIENPKELSQFIGSAGQCLLAFSNAKTCAMFLQENRFLLAKNHSKVILLTPKEIPVKTLAKFTKIGLTESILESAPPKTLLYKVKLLLRSIKSSSAKQEENDQVVKSMLDTNQLLTTKGEIGTDKINNGEQESVNYLAEEKAKFKADKNENSVDNFEDLKGKNKYQEESIDTHWKSKQKKETNIEFNTDTNKNEDEENANDIDLYYRGNKKTNSSDLFDGDDLYGKTSKQQNNETQEEDNAKRKIIEETVIKLDRTREKKKEQEESTDEDDNYELKTTEDNFTLDSADELPKQEEVLEDPIERKKRELKELDDLFEAAKKKQKEELDNDLGGHYKGDIDNSTIEIEEATEKEKLVTEEEYDNSESERNRKPKQEEVQLNLEKKKRKFEEAEEESSEKKKEKNDEFELSSGDMSGKDSAAENIETTMQGKLGQKKAVAINLEDGDQEEAVNNEELENDSNMDSAHNINNEIEIQLEAADKKEKKQYEVEDEGELRNKSSELANTKIDFDSNKNVLEESIKEELEEKRTKETSLNLIDGENSNSKEKNELKEESDIALKKTKETNLNLEDGQKNQIHNGKVDQIDTYYGRGDKKTTEQDWDNLTTKNRDIELKLERSRSNKEININGLNFKDAGEITIDYRKLKEEFDEIARNGSSEDSAAIGEKKIRSAEDPEENDTFKVIDVNARGFDFAINMINLIYKKDTKNNDFYSAVAEELLKQYKGYSVFYYYKLSEKKHFESYDSFSMLSNAAVTNELKEWWVNHKKEESIISDYFLKMMTTWICREIKGQKNGEDHWEDVELPSWAQNELTSKKVELVFPYFDGVDRMGVALVFFPEGLDPKMEKHILVTLETVRTILLDSIQRKSTSNQKEDNNDENGNEKKNILNLFSGMFNRNKAS